MKKEILDAQGLACPMPVIQTKKIITRKWCSRNNSRQCYSYSKLRKNGYTIRLQFLSEKKKQKIKYIVTNF